MYLQYQVSEKGADNKTSIVFYSILILYILSTAIIALDVAKVTGEVYLSHYSAGVPITILLSEFQMVLTAHTWTNISVLIWNANILLLIGGIMIGCADFISQIILVSINL